MSTTPKTPRLSLEGLSCAFGPLQAVSDLSLDIAAGEIVCLLGPSGCGKTTTLRVAAGVERQQTGRVLVDGRVVSDQSVHQPPEARSIGLMFQDFALFPHLTVAENVAFGLKGQGRNAMAVASDYLARVGLPGYEDKYPHMLSGGEQQRVALARAVSTEPRLILADEPTGNLDSETGRQVVDLLFGLQKQTKTTLILITHDERLAAKCGRIIRMADGVIRSEEAAAAA